MTKAIEHPLSVDLLGMWSRASRIWSSLDLAEGLKLCVPRVKRDTAIAKGISSFPSNVTEATWTAQISQRVSIRQPTKPSKTRALERRPNIHQCLACGKLSCVLPTHRKYSQRLRAGAAPASGSTLARLANLTEITNPRIDPFAQYPINMTAEEHYLLDLWARPWGAVGSKVIERHLFPKPNMEIFLPYAMENPLVLRSALALVATQTALPRGKLDALAYDQQQKIAKLHSEALLKPTEVLSDANLLAALCILSNHMAQGEVEEGIKLIKGINGMVTTRGGPQYLGMKGVVAGYLLMANHIMAVCECIRPFWSFPLPSLQFPAGPPVKLGSGFWKQDLDPELCRAATDLCRAAQIYDLGCRRRADRRQLESFNYLSTVAEYQLTFLHAEYYGTSWRGTCICLALLLFNHVVLRNSGSVAPFIRLLEGRFWKLFQQVDWSGENPYFLMWILITATISSSRASYPFFEHAVQALHGVQHMAKVRGWQELKEKVLEPFIWLDIAQEGSTMEIWRKIVIP